MKTPKFSKKKREKHIAYAQNFVKDPSLVRLLIRHSTISPSDTVVEIGPGRGIITKELCKSAERVIAVEKDRECFEALQKKFAKLDNLKLWHGDFLRYPLKRKCKIFANPPFNITSKIIEKIVKNDPPILDSYLFLQRETATRYCSVKKEPLHSMLVFPWFQFKIVHKFHRTDFSPVPGVDIVVLRISARKKPLLDRQLRKTYTKFVQYGFQMQQPDLKSSFKKIFTSKQWSRLVRDIDFPVEAVAADLKVEQWAKLFTTFTQIVDVGKQKNIG